MKTPTHIITFLLCQQLFAEPGPGDIEIPGGKFQYLYKLEIENTGSIACRILGIPTDRDSKWASAIAITISAKDDGNSTQVSYSPEKDMHSFDIRTIDGPQSYSYVSQFLKLVHDNQPVALSVRWQEDGTIFYEAKDSNGQYGSGYIINSKQKFEGVSVTGSGIKGNVYCLSDERWLRGRSS